MHAAVPAHPDDDRCSGARRAAACARSRQRIGTETSAGYSNCWGLDLQPDPHALYDARDLSLFRPHEPALQSASRSCSGRSPTVMTTTQHHRIIMEKSARLVSGLPRILASAVAFAVLSMGQGCTVGPAYVRPAVT